MEEENIIVKVPVMQEQPSEGNQVVEGEPQSVPKGTKTDPALLLESLQEEREKRRIEAEKNKILEEELNKYKTLSVEQVAFSDEGKALEKKLDLMASELSEFKKEKVKQEVITSYPVLREKWEEFEDFRTENKGMNMKTAAKAFLVENGILETPRKGLEKTTGGSKVPTASGMTTEEIKQLRTTNFRKYQELIRNGQMKVE